MFLPKPVNKEKIDKLVSALEGYFSLQDYNIVWDDGERSIPEIWMLHPSRRFTYFALLSLYGFAANYIKDKRVLDFGSGVGYGSYYLASRGAKEVWGIEIDEKSYRYACDRYKNKKLKYLMEPVESLSQDPERKHYFDFIYCSNVMEHIQGYKGALEAVKKLLAPGGLYLQITPPSGKAKGNPYHVTNFTVPQWREILKDDFPEQRYFAHIPACDRENTNNEFDFAFKECEPKQMNELGSISGMILCQAP